MDLKDYLAVSGYPGLYKMVAQTRNGVIVESLIDGKRMPAYATSKISSLEDIAIYTEADEVPLKDVFRAIFEKENGGQAVNHNASVDEVKSYFESVLPDYDRDRVHLSDMRRLFKWYNLLAEKQIFKFDEAATEEAAVEESAE